MVKKAKKISENTSELFSYKTKLIHIVCPECGLLFAVQESFNAAVILQGGAFFCPAGHELENVQAVKDREKRLSAKKEAERKIEEERKAKKAAERKSIWKAVLWPFWGL